MDDARSYAQSLGDLAHSYELVWFESACHVARVRTPCDSDGLRMIVRTCRVRMRMIMRI